MINYICKKCDDLSCESSTCPVCGNRTDIESTEVFYCSHCNIPLFEEKCSICGEKAQKIGADVRPVFARERLLIEVLLGKPMAFAGKSVWNTVSNMYWIDGEKLKVELKELRSIDSKYVIEQLKNYEEENKQYVNNDFNNPYINAFVEANKYRLNTITEEAFSYIRGISKGYDESSLFVSFSGGKDSTVTSSLVMRSLGTEKIIHIYGDTTLEYPESENYIKEFKKSFPQTPMLVARNNEQQFTDLCTVVGPPSRVLRWCCTVFKTGAITKKIEHVFKDKKRLVSFQGIRRAESVSRSKYERTSTGSKISKQIAASPIIDWLDFDVWLYILANHIPFNNAYRQGFSRVGCWCCPNNSTWSEYLSSIYMPEEYKEFHELLYDFAKKVGKEDWKVYVDSGNWKARQGGNGLEYSKNSFVSFKPCAFEEDAYNFDLPRPISDELYTLFKPFGKLDFEMGNKRLNEVFVVDKKTDTPILKLSGRKGTNVLRISVLNKIGMFKYSKTTEQALNSQITKYQTCIGCGYCQSVCKFNALKVLNTQPGHVSNQTIRYTINAEACVGCLECVTHFDGGCYMKKVIRVKKENE